MPQPHFKKIALCVSICFSFLCFSQEQNILFGRIVDSQTVTALSDVVVSVQNTPFTSITDGSGSFVLKNVPKGKQLLHIKHIGYESQLIPVILHSADSIDLHQILLVKKTQLDASPNTVVLSDAELMIDDTDTTSEAVILINAQMDAFQRAAAFNFGAYRFRQRGLDNSYSNVLINGLVMNKLQDGRPQWNTWGGLNDVTRNFDFTIGSRPSEKSFGSINGTHHISTRASEFAAQSKIAIAASNSYYNQRIMATHSSGVSANGWAYLVSVSKRWAEEGYFEGTLYDANSILLGIEKIVNPKHSINFTGIITPNERGKNSYNSEEVSSLTSYTYNSYWGYQNGKKRNSRIKKILEPLLLASHYWTLNDKTQLQTNAMYQWGSTSNSRLDYAKANNPNPSYYKYLPSYYLNLYDTDSNYTPDYERANQAATYFKNNPQINWDNLYAINQQNGESVYFMIEDVNQDKTFQANTILFTEITPYIVLQSSIAFRQLLSNNYSQVQDLLGGLFIRDTDSFLKGNDAQSNLITPNRQVAQGETFRYNYRLTAQTTDAFVQLQFTYPKWECYWSQSINYTAYQRNGLYKNGLYPNYSLGKSDWLTFENLGSKVGATYKLNGVHQIQLNLARIDQAPTLKNTFRNPRINNYVVPDLTTEKITSLDLSYFFTTKRIKNRITAYFSQIKNNTNLAYYYTEGLGILTPNNSTTNYVNPNAFVTEITTGIDKKNTGVEWSLEYKISPSLKAYSAVNWGRYVYANNPHVYLNIDNLNSEVDLGTAALKNYRQSGMPQQAYSLGLEYRNPHFWWVGSNINYLTNNYLSVSPLMRTDNFFINPDDQSKFPFQEIDPSKAKRLLQQEKLDTVFTLNLIGGKTWKINQQIIGVFVVINNVLNQTYKIGSFETSRNANYQELAKSQTAAVPSFGANYAYSFGRTYFMNVYIKM